MAPGVWLPLVLALYWVMLFTATHIPIKSMPNVPGGDKSFHLVAYGILATLFGFFLVVRQDRSLTRAARKARRFPFVGALTVLAVYAVFDELTQSLVGRQPDIFDCLADLGGIIIGLLLAVIIKHVALTKVGDTP